MPENKRLNRFSILYMLKFSYILLKVIRKGYMRLHSKDEKDFWFVLTIESLSLYKCEKEKNNEHTLLLGQHNICELIELSSCSERPSFVLLSCDKK